MHKFKHRFAVSLLLVASLLMQAAPVARAQSMTLNPEQQLLREIFQELIEINTVDPEGNVTQAAEAMAARLRAAGFAAEDARVLVPAANAKKGNLVARYRSPKATGKPLLLLAHIDVVAARKEDWSSGLDPFKFTERDGYYYGRGTMDDKAMAAIFIANLIRFKRENYQPERDIIVALTADEESGDFNGVEFLLREHRALVDAEFGINEGGRGYLKGGVPLLNAVQASEKVYQSFRLEAKNKGGHSSLPVKENAIYQLAAALDRLAKFDFPVNLNEVTRAYFERMAKIEKGQTAADMKAVAQARPPAQAVARPRSLALLQRAHAYHLRRDARGSRTRRQRLAADGACHRQLPHPSAGNCWRSAATLTRVWPTKISITPIAVSKPESRRRPSAGDHGPIEEITQAMWPDVPSCRSWARAQPTASSFGRSASRLRRLRHLR
jgi:hypothetical protein